MEKAKRIVITGVQRAVLEDYDAPSGALGHDEVAGTTLYTLLSAGTELNIYLGHYDAQGLSFGRLPFVPGYAATFRVTDVGDAVEDIEIGDVVYCMGKHAAHQRYARSEVIPLPDGLPPETAVFARLANISMSALTTTRARPPDRVVITGLGLVGLLGAMIFDAAGYEVFAVDPVASRRGIAAQRGIANVGSSIDIEKTGRVPLVLDCSGHEQAVLDGLLVVEKGGEVVVAGVPMVARTEMRAQEILNALFRSFATLRSGKEQQVAAHPTEFRTGSQFENMAAAMRWVAEGRISVDGLYSLVSPADAQDVYQKVLHMRQDHLGMVFDWSLV